MRDRVRSVALLVVWMLPASTAKNALLRALGHAVHARATARSNLVWRVDGFAMAPDARIGRWNVFKNISAVHIGESAAIGRWNLVSAHPVFVRLLPGGASLRLDAHAKITSRHQLDCSGSVTLGAFASLAGHQSRVMSHSVDLRHDAQAALPVRIGERSFVGTRALILGGAVLPPRSVLGAGSVLVRSREDDPESGLWAGVPARHRGPVSGAWFDRDRTSTSDVWLTESDTIVKGVV